MAAVRLHDGVAGILLGDVLLTLWRTPAREQRIRRVTEWTLELLEQRPGTFAACQFLLPSASPPDRAGRAEAWRGFGLIETRARRLITVPLGDAFWQRVVRTIIRTGLLLCGPRKRELIRVTHSEEAAFELLDAVATPASPDTAAMAAGVATLHRALETAP